MRFQKHTEITWALTLLVLCCAHGLRSRLAAAEPSNGQALQVDEVRIVRPRGMKLQPVVNSDIELHVAPALATAYRLAPQRVPRRVSLPAKSASQASAGSAVARPKMSSKTALPPAGARPQTLPINRKTVPLPVAFLQSTANSQPAELSELTIPAALPIPYRNQVRQAGAPATDPVTVQLANGYSLGVPTGVIQQVGAHTQVAQQRSVTTDQSRPQQSRSQPKPRQRSVPQRSLPHRRPADLHVLQSPPRHAKAPQPRAPQTASRARSQPAPVVATLGDQPQHPPRVRQVADNGPRITGDGNMLLPIETVPTSDEMSLDVDHEGLKILIATGADLPAVLRMIADEHNLNLVLAPDIRGSVTVSIRGARLEEMLDAILGVAGFAWHRVDNLLYVTGVATEGMDPRVQGRVVQVYPLDYVSATELEPVANGLVSAVGTVHTISSASDDLLKTRELLVVEDTAAGHHRIAQYIAQIDIPPRQVLIEAHVLQIALSDQERHGVNLQNLARLDGSRISLAGSGFADENPEGPSLALQVDGRDMDALVELIQQHTNSRTLASPKVSVVNHQEAKIQIGQRLPYSVATTTQTSTVQSVQFLEVGIVLTVTPVITEDGNILMTVLPKVSGGKISENGFPEEDTTEVQTTVLMPDGGGIVIGGLIREDTTHSQASVPGLGKIPVMGRLFKRKSAEARRNELIVALVTHVLPDVYSQRCHELDELNQTLPNHARIDLKHPAVPIKVHGARYHR